MTRTRIFVLALLISLGVLSYISFDSYIKPVVIGIPQPIHDTHNDSTPKPPPAPQAAFPTPNPQILLVSAFFPLSKSKHTISDYKAWLTRFLQPITTPIYFFTTPDMAPLVLSLRGSGLPITINTSFASPLDVPPLKDGVGTREMYEEMYTWDRERHRHSPELYAVWAAKPYFLDEGLANAEAGGGLYDYAFWTDAGSFRDDHDYTLWPDPQRVREVWEWGSRESGTPEEDLLFFPMWAPPHQSMKFWEEGMGPIDNEFSEGSFFGGSPHTIQWWRSLYYDYHDHYLERGIFVGKDQTLINALFVLYPKRIISVWLGDPAPPSPDLELHEKSTSKRGIFSNAPNTPLGACGSTWYYYQFFFASAQEREGMRRRWGDGSGGRIGGWLRFWKWGVKKPSEEDGRCRLTHVIAMESLLKSVFGDGWGAPPVSLPGH